MSIFYLKFVSFFAHTKRSIVSKIELIDDNSDTHTTKASLKDTSML